jgi:transcriptional regulator with XRE-family HTH domain
MRREVFTKEDILNKLAKVIVAYREKRGISQEKLSLLINKDRVYISKIERKKMIPSLPVLFDIANALNIKTSRLLSEIEKIDKDAKQPKLALQSTKIINK